MLNKLSVHGPIEKLRKVLSDLPSGTNFSRSGEMVYDEVHTAAPDLCDGSILPERNNV